MTTKQRKALQAVALVAGEFLLADPRSGESYVYSCNALDRAFTLSPEAWPLVFALSLSHAYWYELFGGGFNESVGSRAGVDDFKEEARKIRLTMLALLHTLIGTGDFEDITGFQP